MRTFNILTYFLWIFLSVVLLIACSASKKTTESLGNPFPIVGVESVSIPISIYSCESILFKGDTIKIDRIMCSDSVRFAQLFSDIEVSRLCIYAHIEGTTWYSVVIGSMGEFESLKVIREVNSCFKSTTDQIEEILGKSRIIEKEYFNTELLFYHKFRIHKNEN